MPVVDLPRRRFGGVDPQAAQAAVAEQRRMVADLTEHLARVEGQLETARAERDAALERVRVLESQVTEVLVLATRAAHEAEEETNARVVASAREAQRRVDALATEAATAAQTATTLAQALLEAVGRYQELLPLVVEPATYTLPPTMPEAGTPDFEAHWGIATRDEVVPEEPFVLEDEPAPVVVEQPEAPTPVPAEQPPTYTSVVARPLPSPAAAVDVEQRLAALAGVREVTLTKLGSTEAAFTVAHDPGTLDLTPLTRLGVPVAVD